MTQGEQAFLLALGAALAVSLLVVGLLWRPLRGILANLCGSETRAAFWTSYSAAVLVLAPLVAVMLGRGGPRGADSLLFQVIDQVQWGLLGLLAAMLVVALGVVAVAQPRSGTVHVSPDQMDDLQRLLAKVEEIRARNILRRVPEQGQSSA
jgi:hypothetical protein